ncbi:hypothetical protein ACCO45_005402 [Purpureocillium lilacinum]|uniref:Uncharacterized protein n=1 Tax=Purpureocillium lilacinum TaxID=33203 RepID=A0ACC4DVB5_PURLI
MRFSASAIVAALPLLASAAQEDPFAQYKAQLQNILNTAVSYIPNPGKHDPVAALEAKMGSMRMSTLTLENWRDTLTEHVTPKTTVPDEWWVLISGRNKTCFVLTDATLQRPLRQDRAGLQRDGCQVRHHPRVAAHGLPQLRRPAHPVQQLGRRHRLCLVLQHAPAPAQIDIYKKRLNFTTTASSDLVAASKSKEGHGWVKLDSWFHPFEGKAAELGLAVPWGYLVWGFNLVPNWLFMILVSFISRSMMSNRMNTMGNERRPGAAGSGARPAAAGSS